MIYHGLDDLIGNTPLVALERYARSQRLEARLFAKLESCNPGGSVKDRVAKAMLDDAEQKGLLAPGAVIIEPTSGNTGIGLAAVAAARGYRAIIVMPDTMTVERRLLMTAYGAEVVLTEGAKGMGGAIERARQLAREIPNSLIPGQFTNPANPAAHETATGPEIWRDTEGKVDVFVAGVGTGGTLSGVGRYLKSRNPEVRVVAVEPFESSVLSGKPAGIHAIQGIGAGFVPGNYDPGVVDEVLRIRGDDAIATARAFARCEGLLIGLSGGAAICAAVELGRRPENRSRVIVTLLPDSGERYLSAGLFDE